MLLGNDGIYSLVGSLENCNYQGFSVGWNLSIFTLLWIIAFNPFLIVEKSLVTEVIK